LIDNVSMRKRTIIIDAFTIDLIKLRKVFLFTFIVCSLNVPKGYDQCRYGK